MPKGFRKKEKDNAQKGQDCKEKIKTAKEKIQDLAKKEGRGNKNLASDIKYLHLREIDV